MATKKEIARRTSAALAAIKQAADDADSGVGMFASHHLEELPPAYWQQHAGSPKPSRERVLGLLELRSHWGGDGEDGVDVFDFTLPGEVTDYVISVRFDDNGEVGEISMES
jgi:hypothetical protein